MNALDTELALDRLEARLATELPAHLAASAHAYAVNLEPGEAVAAHRAMGRTLTNLMPEVREPFLAISARDVRKTGERGEVEVLGAWGKAAQSAMEHFRWMNLHAGYDPRAAIEALTWPGERP